MIGAIITGAAGMLGGLLAVSWRLGRLEQSVRDVRYRMESLERFFFRRQPADHD